jgi:hypothetical protein
MGPTARGLVPVPVLSMKRRFAILLATALVSAFGAAACGVQETQEEVEKGRPVEKQIEKRQQGLEEKLQEGYQKVEEGQ